MTDWSFDAWPKVTPNWFQAEPRGPYDEIEFHVDLGCGTVKKGRIGVDRFAAPGVNVLMDIDSGFVYSTAPVPGENAPRVSVPGAWDVREVPHEGRGLPFPDNSIESIISHHAFEHVVNLVPLVDEIYRVLKPGGVLRAITPLFPSMAAVADVDHKRYFCEDSWQCFCGFPDNFWTSSFSVPYTKARFREVDKYVTPIWLEAGQIIPVARELRVALVAEK